MLSLLTIRKVCAAFDAVAATLIAANLSKSLVTSANTSNRTPDNFPTIAAAISNRRQNPNPGPILDPLKDRLLIDEPPALLKIKAERDPEKLFNLFQSNALNRLVVENRFAFEDTVSRLAGARRFDLIERILERQKTLPQGRREGFVVRIVMLYGKARMPDHALETFLTMHIVGCPRTAKSFNATLKVLSQARRIGEVRSLFAEAPSQYKFELDEISYNIVIKALCEMGSLDSAYLVMVEMEKAGIRPDVVTYTTLISAAYKRNLLMLGFSF